MNNARTETISIKLDEGAKSPSYAHAGDAGADLYANETITIYSGEQKLVGTGVRLAIPSGTFGALYPRSGNALNHKIDLGNCVGVIDAGYRGEVKVLIRNNGREPFKINRGDRIAQIVIQPCVQATFAADERAFKDYGHDDRGEGGFGSTGR